MRTSGIKLKSGIFYYLLFLLVILVDLFSVDFSNIDEVFEIISLVVLLLHARSPSYSFSLRFGP